MSNFKTSSNFEWALLANLTFHATNANGSKIFTHQMKLICKKALVENNVRAVAFREIGKGHQGLETFSRLMNVHGISSKGYEKISHDVHEAYEKVGTNVMSEAASEVQALGKERLNEDPSIVLCECSFDGTWQNRGHSS